MNQNPWLLDREQVSRLLHSHIQARLGELMEFSTFLDERGYPMPATAIGRDGYPLDSISIMSLLSHLVRVFHLQELGTEDNFLRRRTLGEWSDLLLEGWAAHLDKITFFTSGSTGTAKPMTHQRDALLQETRVLADIFQDTGRIVAMVPAHHIYGFLFTLLLPKVLGVEVVEGRLMSAADLNRCLEPSDLVVSHPFQWRYLSDMLPSVRSGVFGVTSTAPCPPETFVAVKARNISRLVEVYGSSETGGLGWREDPDAPFTLMEHWTANGDGEDPPLQRTLPDGETLTMPSPDLLAWQDDRHFRVLGRRDGAVQVAGHNVYPNAIALIIAEHPEVKACTVRLMRPEEGDRLKAFVVPVDPHDSHGLGARLHRWCTEQLRPQERPGSLTFGPSLPVGEMGKHADWNIT